MAWAADRVVEEVPGHFYMVATRAVAALALERAPHSPARNISRRRPQLPPAGSALWGYASRKAWSEGTLSRVWRALSRAHLLASNILLENTRENRLLVWDWFAMMHVHPHAACVSHTQDQALWTILVQNRSLPVVNPCVYLHRMRGYERCFTYEKKPHGFLWLLGQGKFEVVASEQVACTGVGNALFDC